MKYERVGELESKAAVFESEIGRKKLSRRERIERWASLLEQHSGALSPFFRTEYLSPEARKSLRANNSPLALAFNDPVLRADGLSGDTLGEGIAYFALPEQTAHRLLCDCHYGGTMTGRRVASRLRSVAGPGILTRMWEWAAGR